MAAVITVEVRSRALLELLADAIEASRATQDEQRLFPLEQKSFYCLSTGEPEVFLRQKPLFHLKTPGPVLERISRYGRPQWRIPPLAELLANENSRHLSLDLGPPEVNCPWTPGAKVAWTTNQLTQLCEQIGKTCQRSLGSLQIIQEPLAIPQPWFGLGDHFHLNTMLNFPGLYFSQLDSTVSKLSNLKDLCIEFKFPGRKVEDFVDTLAANNPHIRDLRINQLTKESLHKIAKTWPLLETLHTSGAGLSPYEFAEILAQLRNLKSCKTCMFGKFEEACVIVARAHDPTTPPYSLVLDFKPNLSEWSNISGDDLGKLFIAFPALYGLSIYEGSIPAVCNALEAHPNIRISKLTSFLTPSLRPHILEPLLALQGTYVNHIYIDFSQESTNTSVDLGMIGNFCPNLEILQVRGGTLLAGGKYEVLATFFSKLHHWTLDHWCLCPVSRKQRVVMHLPHQLVCCLLASPDLERIDNTIIPISEAVVTSVVALSGQQGALSSLKELAIWHSNASVEGLAELVSRAPRLANVVILSDSHYDAGAQRIGLSSFLHLSGLQATVSTRVNPLVL